MNGTASPTKIIILVLAIIGLLTVFGVTGWGVAKLIKGVHPWNTLASLLSSITLKKEVIQPSLAVTASANPLTSGEPLTVNWQYDQYQAGGTYTLHYPCLQDIELHLLSTELITCDLPFHLESGTTVTVIPNIKGSSPTDLPIEIGYVPPDTKDATVKGSLMLTISPAPVAAETHPATSTKKQISPVAETPGETTTNVYPLGTVTTHKSGAADLAIEIIDTGVINDATNIFQHATSVNATMRAGVIFDIKNLGGVPSQPWTFRALLPVANGNFNSDVQDPLAPGARIRFTIGFKEITSTGSNPITITVDPANQLSDADRDNNSASTTIYRSY